MRESTPTELTWLDPLEIRCTGVIKISKCVFPDKKRYKIEILIFILHADAMLKN